jgi:hypothetical protein
MKDDFVKLLTCLWLCGTAYGIYEIWANVSYIADLMDAYMRAALGQIRK